MRPLSACALGAVLLCARYACAQRMQPSLDGSGHHPVTATNAVGTEFQRRAVYYSDGLGGLNMTPNARSISNIVLGTPPFRYNAQGVSTINAAWGQFLAHDMVMTSAHAGSAHSNVSSPDVLYIPIPTCDPDMDATCSGTQALRFSRNLYNTSTGTSASNPRRQLNSQTGWIDLSTVYGTSPTRLISMRTFLGGQLKADPVNGAPVNIDCQPMAGPLGNSCQQRLTGDPRGNVAPGIFSLQGLFILEHNRWAAALAKQYPSWTDEQLFQAARRRNIAVHQVISYNEYLPIILNDVLPPYTGFNPAVDPRVDPAFAVAAYRYGHSGIDQTYLCVAADGSACKAGHLLLRETYFRPAYLDWGITIADILRGMVVQPEQAIDTAMVPDVRNFLEGIMNDLASMDIMRGRDFGIPTYAQARAELNLPVPTSWADVSSDVRVQAALQAAYGNRVDLLDLWVGGLAEAASVGALLGPTFKAIIRSQFLRSRDGDMLWWENTVGMMDGYGFPWIDNSTRASIATTKLSAVIARNTAWTTPPASVFVATDSLMAVSSSGGVASASTSTGAASTSSGVTTTTTTTTANSATNSASAATASTVKATVNSVLALEWAPITASSTTITITFTFQGTGWFGMGLGSSVMAGADTWMMRYSGGSGQVVDSKATGYAMPSSSETQDVRVTAASQNNGVTVITCTRSLNTGDANDVPITAGAMPVVFAWDPSSTTFGYHAGNRIAVAINFFQAANAGGGVNGSSNSTAALAVIDNSAAIANTKLSQFGVHGLTMFMTWGVLVPAGTLAMRFLKHMPAHQAFHKFSMITAATVTLPAAAAALVQSTSDQAIAHRYVGLMLATTMALQIIMGVTVRGWLRSDAKPPPYWMKVRFVHKALGYVMVLLGLTNCFLGAEMLLLGWGKWMLLTWVVGLVILFIVMAIYDEWQKDRQPHSSIVLDKDNARRMAMSQAANSLTMAEVRANVAAGCKWVLLQNYVYDIGPFLKNHPGGAYLLERCIGSDVTQMFLGREAFDTNVRPHAHSQRAYHLLRTMCVAVLKSELEVSSWADTPSMPDDSCTDAWRLVRRTQLPGDDRRPIVKLEFFHPSAEPTAAIDWKPASFGRYMIVKAPQAAAVAAREANQGRGRSTSSHPVSRILERLPSFSRARSEGRRNSLPRGGAEPSDFQRGSITGITPKPVAAAMKSWYARSSRRVSAVELEGGPGASYEEPREHRPRTMSPPRRASNLKRSQMHSSASDPKYTYAESVPGDDDDTASLERTQRGPSRGDAPSTARMPRSGPRAPLLQPGEASVERPYTIVRPDGKNGLILYVRRYPQGLMSNFLYNLREGDDVLMSGPKGLGMHLDETQGGIVVAIVQGTCACTTFDLLQHIQARVAQRRAHAQRRGGVEPWSRAQLDKDDGEKPMPPPASVMRRHDQAWSADETQRQDESRATAAPGSVMRDTRGRDTSRGARNAAPDPLEQLLSTPAPIPPPLAPSDSSSPQLPGSVNGDGDDDDNSTTAAAMRRLRHGGPPRQVAQSVGVPIPETIRVGSVTTTLARQESRYRNMLQKVQGRTRAAPSGPSSTPAPGVVQVVVESDIVTESQTASEEEDDDLPPKSKKAAESAPPRFKVVLMVVAEHESSIPELEWLRYLDTECPDFELHINIMAANNHALVGTLPRVSYGRLTARRLEKLLPPANLLTVSICGTPSFTAGVQQMYRDMGLPRTLLSVVS